MADLNERERLAKAMREAFCERQNLPWDEKNPVPQVKGHWLRAADAALAILRPSTNS
jgi:hypothetical protein